MLDWLKRKDPPPSSHAQIRELLFGDVAPDQWAANGDGEPWRHFREATEALARGDRSSAQQSLHAVVNTPRLEGRHYVEAWNGLRVLGVNPPADQAKRVCGVVLDVPMHTGLDTLAAYEDGSARYLNYSGRMIVWDAAGSDAEIDARVEGLLAAGRGLVVAIGPWAGARPPLGRGNARISLLTPSGLHFGEGPLGVLSQDRMAAPLLNAGAAVVQALTARASQA